MKENHLGMEKIGLSNVRDVHRNLPAEVLVNHIVDNQEGRIGLRGAAMVDTGIYTGRSPDDKYIVDETSSNDKIWWGPVNRKVNEDVFNELYEKATGFYNSSTSRTYMFDGFAGADPAYRIAVRIIAKKAWQAHFAHNMFIRPKAGELEGFVPDFTIINASDIHNDDYQKHGLNSKTFILFHLGRRIAIIGGTEYGGEMKKGIFSVLHYILPQKGVLSMHCSANTDNNGQNSAIFFGLSGTGKTTLSTDPDRPLIGDDEHGWSDKGIFNFEGGCYAKCINLKEKHEPQIWNAIKNGAVLENVVINKESLKPDFDDGSLTENTRAAYPLSYIPGAIVPSVGSNPKVIIFLTADAMGVLPPVSKLSKDAAMFHFMSGYTSKLAGTERGVKEPKATFSKCFGAPFMPRPASVYAEMLGEKISKHNTAVYLINTGWSGGPYGVGIRIKIEYSRAMVTAALTGSLDIVKFVHNDIFNLDIPTECPGVPSEILEPKNTWTDRDAYDLSAKKLAQMFVDNFRKFDDISDEIRLAGPRD